MEFPTLTKFSDLRSNFAAIKELRRVFHEENASSIVCMIVGAAGSGKSSLAKILEHELNAEVLVITERIVNLETTVTNFANHRTISNMFNPRRKLIFFDDSDVLCAIEKNVTTLIQKVRANVTVVCTVTSSEERKVSNIKKISTHLIKLSKMSFKEAYLLIGEQLESVFKEDDGMEDQVLKICKEHEGNLNLIVPYVNTLISTKRSVSKKNDLEPMHNTTIYEQSRELLSKRLPEEVVWCMTIKDTALISLLVHENLPNLTIHKKKPGEIQDLIKVYEAFVDYDMYERMTFSKCQWGYPGGETIHYVRFAIVNSTMPKYKRTTEEIKFTQQFTKLSTQMANKKKFEEVFEGNMRTSNLCEDMVFAHSTNQHLSKTTEKGEADLIKKFAKDFIVCK
jgi:ABC-type dipeptide/oligopeptide/nickel transport system ATPase component